MKTLFSVKESSDMMADNTGHRLYHQEIGEVVQ
jgi:hypothetical protein